jgi:hypothetical protein
LSNNGNISNINKGQNQTSALKITQTQSYCGALRGGSHASGVGAYWRGYAGPTGSSYALRCASMSPKAPYNAQIAPQGAWPPVSPTKQNQKIPRNMLYLDDGKSARM